MRTEELCTTIVRSLVPRTFISNTFRFTFFKAFFVPVVKAFGDCRAAHIDVICHIRLPD